MAQWEFYASRYYDGPEETTDWLLFACGQIPETKVSYVNAVFF